MSTNASHPIPPSDRIADQGPMLIGVTCMLLVLSSAAVGGRYISRRLTGINFAADDYLVFGAYVSLREEGTREDPLLINPLLGFADRVLYRASIMCALWGWQAAGPSNTA